MKKNYIMGVIACVALTMTSCSNDEIGGNNTKQGDPIEFGVYLGRDAQGSRGTSITTEYLTKFGVTAYYMNSDTPDIMYNQAVIKNGNSWTYSPVNIGLQRKEMSYHSMHTPHIRKTLTDSSFFQTIRIKIMEYLKPQYHFLQVPMPT